MKLVIKPTLWVFLYSNINFIIAKFDFDTEGDLKKVVLGPNFDFKEYIFPKGTIIEAPKNSRTIKTAKKLGWNCIEI